MSRLKTIWRLLNLPCEGMSQLSSQSLDRELSRLERFALGSHVLYCSACRRYRRQLILVRRAMRRLAGDVAAGRPSPLPMPPLPDAARERIRRAMKGD